MHPDRIVALLEPFLGPADVQGLTAGDLDRISTYIDLLQRWNARINLTAVRDPEEMVTRHFGESLFAANHLFPGGRAAPQSRAARPARIGTVEPMRHPEAPRSHEPGEGSHTGSFSELRIDSAENNLANDQQPRNSDRITLADIGSGPGFPGIPIKLWAPQISLTLIESNYKKATFLREVTRVLRLTDINIQTARAQDLLDPRLLPKRRDLPLTQAAYPNLRHSFAVVTLRAVERFGDILPSAAALVAPGGRLALLIGFSQTAQATTALPTFEWHPPIAIPRSKSRLLMIGTSNKKQWSREPGK